MEQAGMIKTSFIKVEYRALSFLLAKAKAKNNNRQNWLFWVLISLPSIRKYSDSEQQDFLLTLNPTGNWLASEQHSNFMQWGDLYDSPFLWLLD